MYDEIQWKYITGVIYIVTLELSRSLVNLDQIFE